MGPARIVQRTRGHGAAARRARVARGHVLARGDASLHRWMPSGSARRTRARAPGIRGRDEPAREEGGVHRYKGHAVRKNVALKHGTGALAADGDAWETAFGLACLDRLENDSELVPYWVYPVDNGAMVERHILALPLTRELDRLKRL